MIIVQYRPRSLLLFSPVAERQNISSTSWPIRAALWRIIRNSFMWLDWLQSAFAFSAGIIVLGFIVHQLYCTVCVCVKTEKWKRKDIFSRHWWECTTTEHKIEWCLCLLIITFQTWNAVACSHISPRSERILLLPDVINVVTLAGSEIQRYCSHRCMSSVQRHLFYCYFIYCYFLLHYVDVWLFLL